MITLGEKNVLYSLGDPEIISSLNSIYVGRDSRLPNDSTL